MLDPRRLRLLRDLARLGTISAVADAHRYTASAVSQQLSALEREAGAALLTRSGRRVELTPAGHVLVRHAEVVLDALEQAEAAVASAGARLSGPLRIGAFPTAVRTLLPAALVRLGQEHPDLELHVSELDPAAVPDALRERRVDVGLLHDYDVAPVDPDPALDTAALLDEPVHLAVPAGTGTASIDDARDSTWVVGSPGTLCHTVALRLCRAAGFHPRVRHHADDFTTVLALVGAGQGVAVVPRLAVPHPPADVRLVPLSTRRRTRVAFRRGSAGHPVVAAAVAALDDAARAYGSSTSTGISRSVLRW
ncbi:LysR family transcriptional regulator [Actinokineospora soli]|uniref:LysR family transcriptional regulator n=1 Tax=Actinokineospora soli TaxID=1048753 RepID=A0ABW2TW81_9PSEU